MLSINGAQSVTLKKGTIESKNYFKQIPVPFEIYTEFKFDLKSIQSYEGSYSKKHQDHIPCILLTSLFTLIIDLANRLLFL